MYMQISTIAKLIHAPTEEHVLTVLIHSPVNVLLATLAPTATPVSMHVLFRSGVAFLTTDVCQENMNCFVGFVHWYSLNMKMGVLRPPMCSSTVLNFWTKTPRCEPHKMNSFVVLRFL